MIRKSPSGARMVRLLNYAPVILLVLLAALFFVIDPKVLSWANMLNIVAQATPIAVLAIGAMVVLISGGIDLSAAYGVAFCSTLIASRLDAGDGLLLSLLIGLLAMGGIGLVNGLLVARAKVPPFVATLATMIALQGATLAVAQKGVLILEEPVLRWIGIARTGGIPNVIGVAAVLLALSWLLMRRTRFGLRTYAVGSDMDAAELAGIPIKRQLLLVYATSGVFVFLTAVIMISRVPVVTPNVGGITLLLDAIAAAVLGGTSVFGGRGSVVGVIAGALIVSLVTTALRIFGTDPSSIELWKGAIIIAALAGDTVINRLRARAIDKARH
ncbi:ABC transporter permease [Alloyangia pacifica]|uniref:Ribose transport system permease protein n=1 Tax=Alloyangia pacifica TaxID=311180 RepID=A0A1I6VGZ7_9RHOB|nr:ABC transporter permease [Alloyangia pacifica]SDH97462.1 ribose transport system permease protein [Alloyangia pacifica]SFT12935.1 ribose transport system permease protein [Alloyangia pacifica]